MKSIQLPLTKPLLKELKKLASGQDLPLEAVAAEALLKCLEALDPPQEVEHYKEMAHHFFEEAQVRLRHGDLIQTSEKFWSAASQILKAVAAQT
jgi:hypothetical protein